jgi:hypothetical protein
MIMGGYVSTVYYNLKLKHPSLDMPLIDYDLALLMQPMLMLGVSIGVIFNVIFPHWLITALLITIFLGARLFIYIHPSYYRQESIFQLIANTVIDMLRLDRNLNNSHIN